MFCYKLLFSIIFFKHCRWLSHFPTMASFCWRNFSKLLTTFGPCTWSPFLFSIFFLLDPGANTKVIAYLALQRPLQNQTQWAAQQSLTYGWQAEERLHQWLMVIWFWFMASNELCFTLKSINNWPLDEGGRESLTIIHSWLYQPFTHMHAYSHKQSGFTVAVETIQTGVNALQIIWRVCVYRSTTGRKEGRELCVLCVVLLWLTVGVSYCRLLADSLHCTD